MTPLVDANDTVPVGRSAPARALAESRVDLVKLIQDGLPPREYVPGADGWLAKGKRHHIAAERKTGKSLGIGIIAALDVVAAGGTVVVLDRENGGDEYGRRLASVLDARHSSNELRELLRFRYRYHAWPSMQLEWGGSDDYAEAFAGVDLVIFDSSRTFLTNVRLNEDSADDYSAFTDALIDPLTRAGIATVILDNTGHGEKDRARGSSAKQDLADIAYTVRAANAFNLQRAGLLEMTCRHSRFGEISGTFVLELGGGTYGSWRAKDGGDARRIFHDSCVKALQVESPLGRDRLLPAARAAGAGGRTETLVEWLGEFVIDDLSPIIHRPAGYQLAPLSPRLGTGWDSPDAAPLSPTPPLRAGGTGLTPRRGQGAA